MKAFLDTNVVLDFVCKREPFFEDASKIFVLHEHGEIECVISALTIINSAYIMRKIFQKSEIVTVIEWLCDKFSVSPISRGTILEAVQKDSFDFEDTVQYHSALPYQPDVIITRDKKGFPDLDNPVMTPAEFIERSRGRYMCSPVIPE